MITDLLDRTAERLIAETDIKPAFDALFSSLRDIRLTQDDQYWNEFIKPLCDSHLLKNICLQDPHTLRARMKPRGYAGDAVMMDQLYFRCPPPYRN